MLAAVIFTVLWFVFLKVWLLLSSNQLSDKLSGLQ